MHLFHVNLLATILSAVFFMVIGTFWYSDKLFASSWMTLIGKKKDDLTPNSTMYIYVFLLAIVKAFIFGKVLYYTRITDILGSIELAILIWIGFTAATTAVNYLFEGKSAKLFWINNGYHLVTLLVTAIIMGWWK